MKNTFSDALVRISTSRCTPGHLVLELRLPWYRTLPLSVVEFAAIELDGQPLPLAGATLALDGQSYPLDAMPTLTQAQWFVLDSACLSLPVPGFDPAQRHAAAVLMKLYPPYIPMLVWVTRGTTPQEVAA